MEDTDASLSAARWFIELRNSECLDDIWPAFEAWLGEHPENRAAYAQVETTWQTCERHWRILSQQPRMTHSNPLRH